MVARPTMIVLVLITIHESTSANISWLHFFSFDFEAHRARLLLLLLFLLFLPFLFFQLLKQSIHTIIIQQVSTRTPSVMNYP